jgi:uncharacterized peroxidase-related enzyme
MIVALGHDPRTAPTNQRRRALVDYAIKLTRLPEDMTQEDIAQLRNAGLTDAAIHDAAAIVGYFNFVNRIASGLGVELEEE